MYPPPRVLQWWRYTQYMSVWAESNQPVNPWQPKQIFFPFWRNSPASPASTDYSRHEIITSTSPPTPSPSSSSSRLYTFLCASYNTHDDIDFPSYRLFFPRSFSQSLFFFFLCQLKDTFFTGKINHHRRYWAPRIHHRQRTVVIICYHLLYNLHVPCTYAYLLQYRTSLCSARIVCGETRDDNVLLQREPIIKYVYTWIIIKSRTYLSLYRIIQIEKCHREEAVR